MARVLTIVEVSQKQAYIFASNELAKNIANSNTIAMVTKPEYISQAVNGDTSLFSEKNNLVYNGGGHVILEFAELKQAKDVTGKLTRKVLVDFPDLELFAKSIAYDETVSPSDNIKKLTAELEKKKAIRQASFHQGTFGIERFDVNTGHAERINAPVVDIDEKEEWVPDGFSQTVKFKDLGGSEANFIAVVHIDGNAMGKRVEELSGGKSMNDWTTYKTKMREFSQGITDDFDAAYRVMQEKISHEFLNETFAGNLNYKKSGEFYFPVRRVISEGDDLCFVANGKIGIEAAAIILNALSERVNPVDQKNYAACAGVALVHQKYPFYRAYELAEELCSRAKRLGAGLSADRTGSDVSCIDWHIEYGELRDSLDSVRDQYLTDDGKHMEMRPYIVHASDSINQAEPIRQYANFRKLISKMQSDDGFYGRGLLKSMRSVIREGEQATQYYLKFHKAADIARDSFSGVYQEVDISGLQAQTKSSKEYQTFVTTEDGEVRSTLFDAIEIMDSMVLLGGKQV